MIETHITTRCHSRTIPLHVHDACGALDYLCAVSPIVSYQPFRWAYEADGLHFSFERRSRCGPPDRPHYAPYRQLRGHRHRRGQWPLPVDLELYPWSKERAELQLVLHTRRADVAQSQISRVAFTLLDHLTLRLLEIVKNIDDIQIDRAALAVLLGDRY